MGVDNLDTCFGRYRMLSFGLVEPITNQNNKVMIYQFKGPYLFDNTTISGWNSTAIGVYYCGAKTTDGKLSVYYIGKSAADGGIRARLLQHLSERKWPDVSHFGYEACDTTSETESHEASEITKLKPKYNAQGK